MFTFEVFLLWNAGLYPDADFTRHIAAEEGIYRWSLAATENFDCDLLGTKVTAGIYCMKRGESGLTRTQSENCHVDNSFIHVVVDGNSVIDHPVEIDVSGDPMRSRFSFPTHSIRVDRGMAIHCLYRTPTNVLKGERGRYLPSDGRCMSTSTNR